MQWRFLWKPWGVWRRSNVSWSSSTQTLRIMDILLWRIIFQRILTRYILDWTRKHTHTHTHRRNTPRFRGPQKCSYFLESRWHVRQTERIYHENSAEGFAHRTGTIQSVILPSFIKCAPRLLQPKTMRHWNQSADVCHLTKKGHGVNEDEMDSVIDLRMHMDRSPYTVNEVRCLFASGFSSKSFCSSEFFHFSFWTFVTASACLSFLQDVSLPRIFKLFRGLGLRHLVVVNDRNRVSLSSRVNVAHSLFWNRPWLNWNRL